MLSESKKFLSLKNNEVNLRQGPSFKYPIKLIYKKKYLPYVIIDKSELGEKLKISKIILDGYIFLNYQKKVCNKY